MFRMNLLVQPSIGLLRQVFGKNLRWTSRIALSKPLTINISSRRTFFSFPGKKTEELGTVEVAAEAEPENPRKQAALYRLLLDYGEPETVIRRFEDHKYARDTECVVHYLIALYGSSQLERAAKFILSGSKLDSSSSSFASSATTPFTLLGTRDRPIHVVNDGGSSGGGWSRRISTAVNVVIVGAILYSLFSMNEHKLGGMQTKVHKLFKKGTGMDKVHTFDDVQGCDEAKEELQQVVEFLKNPAKFTKLGAKMPKGVLLVGPPGTGKTLLAKAVAGEADVPFIYASGSEFDEMFVGIGSMRIRQMFQSAKEQAPAIIFIDEIDAVGSKRNARDPQHSRMSLNQLLIELDGFSESTGIVVIAATNFPETLDKALLRPGRFDKHVHVPLPDVQGRLKILDLYVHDTKCSKDVDLNLLSRATPGFSGADLYKLINQAKIMASIDNSHILTMQHLERSRDEMLMGAERKSFLLSEEVRKLTAFHESGHALVAIYTPQAIQLHKATIIPRGSALGLVSQVPDKDEHSVTKQALLARMDVAMGGRVAEELIFGADSVTTGASSDFTQATRIARAIVTQYGMSDKLGPLVVSEEDYEIISPEVRSKIDSEVKELLEESKKRATSIISSRRSELNCLASALLTHETLTRQEIEAVCRGEAIVKAQKHISTEDSEPIKAKSRGFTIFFTE